MAVPKAITTRTFTIILGALVVVSFPTVLLGLKSFVYRDFSLFGYPLAHHLQQSLWQGELPLWNPYNNCGLPFLAQWNTMCLYPLSTIYIVLPLPWGVNLFCLVHLFLAGLGMYLLARKWTDNCLAASVAGIAFAFSGLTLCSLMWPNNIAALAWMPWVVWQASESWSAATGTGRRIVIAALVGAIQMLAGAPEIILFTWGIVGALCLSDRCTPFGRRLLTFAVVMLLIAGLSAAQLFPFFHLLQQSHRSTSYGNSAWSMPVWGWANLIVPLFRMHEDSSGVYFQGSQAWTSSYYAGIGVLALALLAMLKVRVARVWVLAACGLLSLLLALGDATPLYTAFQKTFPFLGFMRFPIKFVVCAMFVLPLLAAYGVKALTDESVAKERATWFLIGAILLAMIVIVGAAFLWPLSEQPSSTALTSAATRAAFLLITLGFVSHIWKSEGQRRYIATIGLPCLVWLDLFTHAPSQNPVVDPSVYATNVLEAQPIDPHPKLGQSRVLLSLDAMEDFSTNRLSNQAHHFLLKRLWQSQNLNLLDAIPKVDGFYSLYLARERAVHYRLYANDDQPRPGLADFLSVSHLTTRNAQETFDWAYRPSSLPMAHIGAAPVFADKNSTLTNLMLPSFDPRKEVFLPPEAQSRFKEACAGENQSGCAATRIQSAHFKSHRIRLDVETPEPAVLTLSQAYYPAWKAYLDDKPVKIWPANHAFQAVAVPPGYHRIEFRYEDKAFRLGTIVSALTLVFCALLYRRSASIQRFNGSTI